MRSLLHNIFDLNQTSYWYPLIWILTIGAVFNYLPKVTLRINNHYHKRWYWIVAILTVFPLILWAGYRHDFIDTYAYIFSFNKSSSDLADIPDLIATDSKDAGFYVLIIILKAMGVRTYTGFFLCLATVQMLCITYFFRKYSPNFWVSIFLFVASTDYLSWMHNTVRQFTAVCILLVAFDLLIQRRYIFFSLVVLLCSTIHGSALIMFPIAYIMRGPALNRKTLLMICGVAMLFPLIDRIMPSLTNLLSDTQYSDVTSSEIWATDDGTSLIRVLVYSAPALISLLSWKNLRSSRDPVMNMCTNASIITAALYFISSFTSGIFIGRLPIYTTLHGYVALPWIIEYLFEKSSAKLIYVIMFALYIIFYYYQVMSTWGLS